MNRRNVIAYKHLLPWAVFILAVAVLVGATAVAQKKQQPKAAQKQESTFVDILGQYRGKQTNLGTLAKIVADHVVFEEENITRIYRIDAIQGVHIERDPDAGTSTVEVYVLAK